MVILEITVQWKRGDSWTVIVEQTMPGSFLPVRSEGLLQLKLTELLAQVSPRSYGTVLGEALFCGDVRDAFVRATRARTACMSCSALRIASYELYVGSGCVPHLTGTGTSWPSTSACPSRSTSLASLIGVSRRLAAATCGG